MLRRTLLPPYSKQQNSSLSLPFSLASLKTETAQTTENSGTYTTHLSALFQISENGHLVGIPGTASINVWKPHMETGI